MSQLPEPLVHLSAALAKLPGIGPRSAERLALHIVLAETESVRHLATALLDANAKVRPCSRCGALAETALCTICSKPERNTGTLCIVERAVDVLKVEKAGSYRGRYHVLGGRISPVQGVEPEDLRIADLERRIPEESIQEVILALATDVEGDATCHYLARRLAPLGARITRLAHGLPAGSGLEFADELTLARAIEGRQQMD